MESASARFGKLVGEHRLGVVITIRGSKPPAYALEQMKLHVLGNEVCYRCFLWYLTLFDDYILFRFGAICRRRWCGSFSDRFSRCHYLQIFVMLIAAFQKAVTGTFAQTVFIMCNVTRHTRFCVKLEIGTKRNGTFGVRDIKMLEVSCSCIC